MRTILIVEDDESLRAMLKLILLDAGYAVLEAATGNEVGPIYQQEKPDLVITDLLMPDKDGLEVIMDLHRRDQNAKIIAISGSGKKNSGNYLLLAQKLGARCTLTKPFTPEEFLEAVRMALESDT
jgi:DNA-binding response OmpR family regulator